MVLWNNLHLFSCLFPLILADNDDITDESIGTILIVLISVFVGLILIAAIIGSIVCVVVLGSHRKAHPKDENWEKNKSKIMRKITPSDYFRAPSAQNPQTATPEVKNSVPEKSTA